MTNQQLQGGTVLVTSTATTPSGTLSTNPTATSKRANNISGGVPHITLNPYSSQLVDNLNLMMPGEKQEVVYRAVSPHGHVYWEIDPQSATAINNPNDYYYSEANNIEIDDSLLRHRNLPESHPLISIRHKNIQQKQIHQRQQQFAPPTTISTSNTFFNTRNCSTPLSLNGTINKTNNIDYNNQALVPEQLQRQVQIRDVKAIPVSVKSSEYIEAKIRTLRANNRNNIVNNNLHHTLPTNQQLN